MTARSERGAQRVVAFQGRRGGRSAFSLVNARWSRGLEASGRYRVVDYHEGSAGAAGSPDFVIHHDFESHFSAFRPPSGARCVAVRTWDFGPLPIDWVGKIDDGFHQYWAYSRWIAQQAETVGVDTGRIRVVPLGVDPELFRPDGDRFPLPTGKSFRFLFVGGVSPRKGTDVLLEAYARAFTHRDDVTLVIKDHSGDLFYKQDTIRERIAEVSADAAAPEIVHLDRFLSDTELAALYRTCDVAVFPYRAEGFCLPILEAMASGTPPIVPDFGACLDFCSTETAYMMPVRRINLPVGGRFKVALGFEEDVAEVDFCEVSASTLADRLKGAVEASAADRRRLAAAGVERAHRGFRWQDSLDVVLTCLEELQSDHDASSIAR